MKPNLFHFATSELSQDAALCWLLSWADVAHRDENRDLHELGTGLLRGFFSKAGRQLPPGAAVKVLRQSDHVDIAVEVGDDHVVLLEDKVYSSEHSDQLARYLKSAVRNFPNRTAVPIYLKTGEQGSFDVAQKAGWHVFKRSELLSVLRSGPVQSSDILRDFVAHLEGIEAAVQAFRSAPPEEWMPRAWEGFFEAIKTEFEDAGWNYVANPNGGFMGFWWGWRSIRAGMLYLQLEEKDLVVKVEANAETNDGRSELRDRWSARVLSSSSFAFRRPKRFGNGAYMTVATGAEPYLRLRENGLLDLLSTIETLRRATNAVQSLAGASS